jgi:hypothetical protein
MGEVVRMEIMNLCAISWLCRTKDGQVGVA